jgi:hypothetical protein
MPMTFKPPFRNALAALALVAVCVCSTLAPARAATLPRLEADSLGGTHVVLPTDAAGKPFVILLAFTPESEADVTAWSRALLQAAKATTYVVVVADKTAFMSRKHIRKIVEGAAVGSREQIDANVLVTFSGAGWQTLVPPGDKRAAGIVVCDASGNVTFAQRIGFSEAHRSAVERALD